MTRTLALALAVLLLSVPAAAQEEEKAKPDPSAALLGWWERRDAPMPSHVHFDKGSVTMIGGGAEKPIPVRYREGAVEIQKAAAWVRVGYEIDGDSLTLRFPDGDWKLRRRKGAPGKVEFKPLPLGVVGVVPEVDRAGILADLQERIARDQKVRFELMQSTRPGAPPDPEILAKMQKVDRENTARLIELIAEWGWIDGTRFGAAGANLAFLIVQHSGDIRLMRTALPLIEKDVKAHVVHGGSYALLYDRTQLMLGKKQRYGSQVRVDPGTGEVVVLPLEDPEGVDARRKEMGLPPLEQYLEMIRRMSGGGKAPEKPAPPEPKEEDSPPKEEGDGGK